MASPEIFDIPIGNVIGPKGDTGNGIESIELRSTSGLNKTYRITMTDGTTFDFVVTDGNGISGVSFNSLTNALTLTFDNGDTYTTPSLKGDTGNGISRIEKTGTSGLVDTYTVTYTNGQTFTYTVTNGADGVSPSVTVTAITGGHMVEIDDASGTHSFNVMDGEDGASDAGEVTYDDTETYPSGSVGGALNHLKTALSDLEDGKQDKTTYVTLSGTVVTQVGVDNTMYLCGELAELTFTAPVTGITAIRFTSGTTPTVVTLNGITMPDDWAGAEADTEYEINVLNGKGVYNSWAVT